MREIKPGCGTGFVRFFGDRRVMKKLFATALIVLFFAATTAEAKNVYVQSKSAKIMASPTFDSKVIGTVKRGQPLKITKTSDAWYRVKTGSIAGWVNNLNISLEKPKERVSLIKESDKTISEDARRRSSALTSAVSARGLSEKERERANAKDDPDYRALEKLEDESKSISDEKVEKFSKTGK